MPYLGKYPSRDRLLDKAKVPATVTSRGMGVYDRFMASSIPKHRDIAVDVRPLNGAPRGTSAGISSEADVYDRFMASAALERGDLVAGVAPAAAGPVASSAGKTPILRS